MSDDTIDLNKERLRRVAAFGESQHKSGNAFKLLDWQYDDDAIGITSDGDVCVIFGDLSGVMMTRDDAERLGRALIEAADSPFMGGRKP